MVWHGGISGSAPIKINEDGHISSLMKNISSSTISERIPSSIDFSQTIFSLPNLLIFSTVVIVITAFFSF
jgi:short-chain fatty acids transporter